MADTDQLREALASIATAAQLALGALDSPEAVPDDAPSYDDIVSAEADATEQRIEAETEQAVEIIEASTAAEVELIEATAAAEADVIAAEAAAEVAVIEASNDDDDQGDDDSAELGDVLDGDAADEIGETIDAATELLESPDEVFDTEPDTAPAPTHWYRRRRTFGRIR